MIFNNNPLTHFQQTWQVAYKQCLMRNMRLASITSEEEMNQLKNQIKAENVNQELTPQNSFFWIGATKLGSDKFYWMGHDKPLIYSDFYTGEANNCNTCHDEEEECIEIRSYGDYQWNDLACKVDRLYICQE